MQIDMFKTAPKTINSLFSLGQNTWLAECRTIAKQLLKHRETITVEDVLKLSPRPKYLHRNTTGRIFDDQFRPVGFTKSKNPTSKGRWIRTWSLK